MPEILDIDQTVEIIETASLEDVLIINENYEFILSELPDTEIHIKPRIVVLKEKVQERIEALT